jgi:DNA repair ATPase RecN
MAKRKKRELRIEDLWYEDLIEHTHALEQELRGAYTTLSASRSSWARKISKAISNRWKHLYKEDIQPWCVERSES